MNIPYEMVDEIISYLSTDKLKTINKKYKQIGDSIELEYGITVIITQNMLKNYLLSLYLNRPTINILWVDGEYLRDDIYFKRYESNTCNIIYVGYCDSLLTKDVSLMYYFSSESKIRDFRNKKTYLPGTDIINYFLLKHPLSNNHNFMIKSRSNTYQYYIKCIKNNFVRYKPIVSDYTRILNL